MSETPSEIAARTRELYHEQHKNYQDPKIFSRFISMVSDPSYFNVDADFFKGKTVLDAGCGNTAYFQVAMHRYGAQHVSCIDIGDEWISELTRILAEHKIPADFTSMQSASTTALPFADESFDFVASNGVLLHLANVAEAERGFEELARVTKRGGSLYVILGVPGGLMNEHLLPAVRDCYRNQASFRQFIDDLKPEHLHAIVELIASTSREKGGPVADASSLLPLLDLDLTTFIQNAVQTPVHLDNQLTGEWAREQFARLGFAPPKRCRRFVRRENIRRFVAPLHFRNEHPISEMVYGEGSLEFIAERL